MTVQLVSHVNLDFIVGPTTKILLINMFKKMFVMLDLFVKWDLIHQNRTSIQQTLVLHQMIS